MEGNLQTEQQASATGSRVRVPVIILCALLALALAGYLALCGVASGASTFYPNETINGVEVGGLTINEAQNRLNRQLPQQTVSIYAAETSEDTDAAESADVEAAPIASVTLAELGYTEKQLDGVSAQCMAQQKGQNFLSAGWSYLSLMLHISSGEWVSLDADADAFQDAVDTLAASLNEAPVDGAYTLGTDTVEILKAKDGREVDENALQSALQSAVNDGECGYAARLSFTTLPAKSLSAKSVYSEISGEMKNAGYDPVTQSITAEQIGAEFNVSTADKLLEDAAPGETVSVPATIEYPAVTADALEGVLFRDVIGTYTTHVGGTAARINNVRLAAVAVNGTVLNCGDIFSYNETVGQRTEAKGYQAAPAYVKGETVDEIGGGVCQPSSTLYYACLLANLEIVQRAAHRYVPAYITKGIDATVSWGGPDYQFCNNTDYPIQIVTSYAKGYLTMKLLGTKTDETYVKMISNTLSKTDFQTVYQDDATIPAGTQQVKVTPYTGYKVETYRNIYNKDGTLLSSTLEAVSDYKVRDELILVGPTVAAAEIVEPAASTGEETPVVSEPENVAGETDAEIPVEGA